MKIKLFTFWNNSAQKTFISIDGYATKVSCFRIEHKQITNIQTSYIKLYLYLSIINVSLKQRYERIIFVKYQVIEIRLFFHIIDDRQILLMTFFGIFNFY